MRHKSALGDSTDDPFPALQAKDLKNGRYEGWPCRNAACGKRVEITDTPFKKPVPGDRIHMWVKCAHCEATEMYWMDCRTIQEYREDGSPVADVSRQSLP
jgi:hypothetical protein